MVRIDIFSINIYENLRLAAVHIKSRRLHPAPSCNKITQKALRLLKCKSQMIDNKLIHFNQH